MMQYFRRNIALKGKHSGQATAGTEPPPRSTFHIPSFADTLSRIGVRRDSSHVNIPPPSNKIVNIDDHHTEETREGSLIHAPDSVETTAGVKRSKRGVRKVKVSMYNYGSPRVGNGSFSQFYNRVVPDSFRTVVDGDLVTSLPPTGYSHVGTQALVDNLGSGSIIIDPSFIERRLRTQTKSSVSVHSLLVYRKVRLTISLFALLIYCVAIDTRVLLLGPSSPLCD